jgi:hypothetical protein
MELRDSYKQITKKDIDVLCGELEIELPNDYVQFLMLHNGGQPSQNHYIKKELDGEISFDFFLNVFFGIGGDDASYDIETMYSIYCDRIPEEILPIGDDGVGNIICLGVEESYYGQVYMWWKSGQVEEGGEPTFDNIDLIDNTFERFLDGFDVVIN